MKNLDKTFLFLLVAVSFIFGLTAFATAQKRDDRDIRDAVRSLNSKIDDFETNLRFQMQSTSANDGQVAEISGEIRLLKNSVQQFQNSYDRKRENRDDVGSIIAAARRIEQFMRLNSQNRRVDDDWAGVRRQIDRLSRNYGVITSWDSPFGEMEVKNPPPLEIPGLTSRVGLSGTYDIDLARSENVDDIVTDTTLGGDQRSDIRDKLTAPNQIALDIRGNTVTLATTTAAPVTFIADGREKTEQSASGQGIRVRATLTGNTLVVSSLGGDTDFTITFASESGGNTLKVSRRITTAYLEQTVFAESIYNKTDSVARLGIPSSSATSDQGGDYSDNDNSGKISNGTTGTFGSARTGVPTAVTSRPGNYTVPNGVVVTGILDNEINTRFSQNNDRFRITVQTPDEFRGATVEGYISGINRSGTVSGASKLTLNFEKITLRNGQTYDFAGNLQSIQAINGKSVSVDNEGTIKGENQTKQTAKRGGIGAGIGAVIGAIAGGAKGAAIGAIIGAGGGAGTVAIQGKTDIQLQQGSTIYVVSSSPFQRDR